MTDPLAPPPARDGSRLVVAPDVESVDATLRFDMTTRTAEARAVVTFVLDEPGGFPAIDLRQQVISVRLDGQRLGDGGFHPVDLGGGEGAEMRVVDADLEAGRHVIEVDYELGTPAAAGAEPLGWEDDGLQFDLWMSDLEPGRYLEMWVPAPLCHDRFSLTLDLEIAGTERPHLIAANGPSLEAPNRWRVAYPPGYTSLSPMLVIAPADLLEERRRSVQLPGRHAPVELRVLARTDVGADLEACESDLAGWLCYLTARYGQWAHGDTYTAVVWASGRGMEYDAATTTSVGGLEHEVFHSWFGRGVKPACASDGWIDEAWTSWATSSRRSELPRHAEVPFDLDADPVLLYPPHPWSRHTPRESYAEGARLFAGLATLAGGAGRMRSAMAAWYREHAGKLATTADLEEHLAAWCGEEVKPLWERYVHGRG